ncbi:MAG TPA: RIP metalloprotease RseP [Bryobacteraceae bacterium]|jgi:regulator of sigma E protease|nr:RIP metalloprotease RseP [Bryobacteraceae bacterium]
MQGIEYFLWFLILIGVMINIHEAGHYFAARRFDVKIDAFSFGFGPRLFGFRRGETDFRFSAIPFGGYVKMAGELVGEDAVSDPRSLLAKPRWQRLIIYFAGPFMNLVLAVAILTGLYMVRFDQLSSAEIGHVMPDSAAAKAGIQDGDRILRLDGQQNPTWDDVEPKVDISAGRPLHLTLERDGHQVNTILTPVFNEARGGGYAGWDEHGEVLFSGLEPGYPADKAGIKDGDSLVAVDGQPVHSSIKFHQITEGSKGKLLHLDVKRDGKTFAVDVQPVLAKLDGPERWMIGVKAGTQLPFKTLKLSLPQALNESLQENAKNALLMEKVLQGMMERRMSTKNLSGPIALIKESGMAAEMGPAVYLGLMAMVSLQLAIFNLLPIPVLDGGSILMLLVEMTMRRDLSLNVKELVFKVGFVCIIMLVAFVIYNDLSRLLPSGG